MNNEDDIEMRIENKMTLLQWLMLLGICFGIATVTIIIICAVLILGGIII